MADEGNMLDLYICRICYNLFDQATALRNCNHIFCWRCINGKIREHGWDGRCPSCPVALGPDPLIQLSHDDPRLTALENPSNNLPGNDPRLAALENPNNNLPGNEENEEEDEESDFEFFDGDEDSDSDSDDDDSDDDEDMNLDFDNDEDMESKSHDDDDME